MKELADLKQPLFTILIIGQMVVAVEQCKSAERPRRPNIIFLLADDLGYGDIGVYGQRLIATPNLDRLANQGMRFTQAYAGGPVCTSSRSVLMTGLNGRRTPARDNVPHYSTYLQPADITVAEVLTRVGYRCGGVGKWSLGDAGTVGSAMNQGFHSWFGFLNQDHAHYYFPEYLDDDRGRLRLPGNPSTRKHYSHDLLVHRGLKFIRESSDRPFFFYAAFTLPHYSSSSEDEHRLAVPTLSPYGDRDWPTKAKKYASMVHMLDRDVGRIVDLVDELGISDETLIIFSSDNGGHADAWQDFDTNGPLKGYKRDLTEGGIRVPMIARWPGTIPEGRVSDQVIAFEDMLPTFADLAEAKLPGPIDGISMRRTLNGQSQTYNKDYLYWDYGHNRRFYDQAVRIGDWKGLRLGKEKGRIRVYDLKSDIGETNDIADQQPRLVAKMRKIFDTAVVPSDRYRIGRIYQGSPIWQAEDYHASPSIRAN